MRIFPGCICTHNTLGICRDCCVVCCVSVFLCLGIVGFVAAMGQIYKEYLTGARIYSCSACKAHAADHADIYSKSFHGRYGRAYLFNNVLVPNPNQPSFWIVGRSELCLSRLVWFRLVGFVYPYVYVFMVDRRAQTEFWKWNISSDDDRGGVGFRPTWRPRCSSFGGYYLRAS